MINPRNPKPNNDRLPGSGITAPPLEEGSEDKSEEMEHVMAGEKRWPSNFADQGNRF